MVEISKTFDVYSQEENSISELYIMASLPLHAASDMLDILPKIKSEWVEHYKNIIYNGEDFDMKVDRITKKLDELIICFSVHNFLSFISDIIKAILMTEPRKLLQVDLEIKANEAANYAFECETIDEFTEFLSSHIVEKLSREGFDKIHNFMKNKLDLNVNIQDKRLIEEVIEIRNMIVHNRGRVSSRFIRITKDRQIKIGSKLKMSEKKLFQLRNALEKHAKAIFEAVLNKYGH